jgi:hypothetical protein
MRSPLAPLVSLVVFASLATLTVAARGLPDDPRETTPKQRLDYIETRADLDGDGRQEGLVFMNALTGRDDPNEATDVMLGVFEDSADAPLLWSRRIAVETDAPAHSGDFYAVDLDGDRGSEIVLTWDTSMREGRVARHAEIWTIDPPMKPRRLWEGEWEMDTRSDESVPVGSREWFRVEIDFAKTRALAGRGIVLARTHRAIAGRVLDEPKVTYKRLDVRLRAW